ncbi:MFS transporter [Paenibacillus sonchi]|uniref:MFS transporter n=1 Tax=Paenibacillus sonchi TaxID=373687 RepID=UPI001E404F1C|nr:MFS transporter [Paenibacillus sonchi]MCE3201627.1 MFS transporter [Paenibacillus sonchi]
MGKKKVTIPVSIGYGLTDLMGGGAFTIIGAWLMFYYTTFVGMSPVKAASIVAIARIVDAVISLFMGSITDHFYKTKLGKKFGRRRFFLLVGSPLMIVYALLWIDGMSYAFYLVCYLMFEIIAALVLIPWETLPSEMTKDFTERTKLSTCRMFISALGTFLATFVPGRLIKYFGDDNSYAYFLNGLIFAVLFAVCIFITYKVTWERELTPAMLEELEKGQTRQSFADRILALRNMLKDYASTFKIRAFRKHLAIYLLSFTAKDIFNTVFVFFCVYCLSISSSQAADLLSLSIIGLPITLLAGFAIIKFGPSRLYTVSYSSMILCLAGFYMIYLYDPSSKIAIMYVLAVVYQMGRSLLEFTPWNVFPFIPDVDEAVTQKRREGLFAAVMTFGRKTTVALATFIVGIVLEEGGFVKGQQYQSPEAISVIANTLMFGASALLVLALIFAWTFKLNKKTHGVLVKEVDRLKLNGSKSQVDPETKKIVEDLTGYKYEKIWNQ